MGGSGCGCPDGQCGLCSCAAGTTTSTQHSVALVAKSTQTEFWLSVFAGAEAAATEYNVKLTIVGPETEEDYETQNRMVAEAVADGAEALVFSAIDYENNAVAIDDAAGQGVKIVAIDSNVDSSRGEHLHRYGQLRRRTDGGPGGPGSGGRAS